MIHIDKEKIIHYDLFSGYGGFSYAADEVWGRENIRHIFCDNDKFCQAVTKRHWPSSTHWKDIRELIAYAKSHGFGSRSRRNMEHDGVQHTQCNTRKGKNSEIVDILTGGFPCQPFSHAGKRRGKSDDRFLWTEMLECIRIFQPTWVIAENVYGLLTLNGGVVFKQVCADMEAEGYEVWPFIIPACAINAPHRRDRVWMVAHAINDQHRGRRGQAAEAEGIPGEHRQEVCSRGTCRTDNNAPDTRRERQIPGYNFSGESPDATIPTGKGLERKVNQEGQSSGFNREAWQSDWKEVALATCVHGVDDGLAEGMDGISEAKHRTERLKMCGNGIVPQVAEEIMRAIKECEARIT